MPKSLEAAVVSQIDATNKAPVLLFELGLSTPLKYAAYKSNVTFPTGGNVYTAKAIQVSGIEQSLEGQINKVTVKFDDVTSDMSAYADNENFKGASLIIKRVYVGAFGSADNYVEVFNGFMGEPSDYDYSWLTVEAFSGKSLTKIAVNFAYQRMCPWIAGESECNTNGNFDLTTLKATGTADSGTVSTLTDSALTQIDDYWNHGNIYITKGSKIYRRKVKDFDAATDTVTFDVNLEVAVDNTCTYEIFKGCDQTWETCTSANAWGPSGDNRFNFGGCIHIESRQDANDAHGTTDGYTGGGGSGRRATLRP